VNNRLTREPAACLPVEVNSVLDCISMNTADRLREVITPLYLPVSRVLRPVLSFPVKKGVDMSDQVQQRVTEIFGAKALDL